MFEKVQLYRSNKLLSAAKDSPICFCCGKHNDGTVVACHSNQQRDGKGMGIKAHDYRIAFCCSVCHYIIDNVEERAEAQAMWERAHRLTIGYFFDAGIVK